jgi:hypothetical protein
MVSLVEEIEPDILIGGWRLLCVGLLHQAVAKIEADSKLYKVSSHYRCHGRSGIDKERLHQRTQARDWINGNVGVVTFEDACEALNVEPERARRMILERAHNRRRLPQSKRTVA